MKFPATDIEFAMQEEIDRLKARIATLEGALREYAAIEGPPYHGTPFLARAVLKEGT
jgi:hypothetical protein